MDHVKKILFLLLCLSSVANAQLYDKGPIPPKGPIPAPLVRSYPIYFAHRGNDSTFPEETQAAFDGVVALGSNSNRSPTWLDIKVRTLGDGTLGVMHDSTVDRTTTSSGAVTSFNATTWAALVIQADTDTGTLAFGDTLAPPTLPPLLTAYVGKAGVRITSEDGTSMAGIIAAVNAAGFPKSRVILQSERGDLSEVTAAKAAGYETEWVDSNSACGSFTAIQLVAAGADWISCPLGITYDLTLTAANIAPYIAAGIKVDGYFFVRRWQVVAGLAMGMSGITTDDIEYTSTNRQLQTTDNFARGYFNPGMIGYTPTDPSYGNRGSFLTGGWYAFSNSAANSYLGQTLGFLSPVRNIANPGYWQFSFTAQYTGIFSGDTSRWLAIWVGNDDHAYADSPTNNDHANGYHILFRNNAQIGIYSRASGGAASLLGQSTTGTTISLNTSTYFCIVVTPTQITAQQTSAANCGGTVVKTVTVTDSTYRGGYLQVGSSGVSYQISNLKVGEVTPAEGSFSNLTSNATTVLGGTSATVTAPITFNFGTTLSQASWLTAGIGLSIPAATFNDTTTGSGGVGAEFAYAIQSPTVTNTQGTANVEPNLGTLYVGAPICGTGWASCTNLYAVYTPGKMFAGTGALFQGATISLNAASNFNVNINTSGSTGTTTIGNASSTAVNIAGPTQFDGTLYMSPTNPAIGSHFNTSSDSIVGSSTGAFQVTVGTGTGTSTGSVTLSTASNGWACSVADVTTPATNLVQQTGSTTTSVTVTNYVRTTGVAGNFTNSDKLVFHCGAF